MLDDQQTPTNSRGLVARSREPEVPCRVFRQAQTGNAGTLTTPKQLAVLAIGGNSLARDPENESIDDQRAAVQTTCVAVAKLIASGWGVIVTHGNGPQVGFVMRRSEIAHEVAGLHEVPIDVCGADTQGATGYLIQQELRNALHSMGQSKDVATVVTQTEVDPADPAFLTPSKPIGSFMTESVAREQEALYGWTVAEDAGRGWRRVVPSPQPKRVVEEGVIATLLANDVCVVAVGGGGIPVVADSSGRLRGIAAVIDKDHASSLLASHVGASTLVICTAVDRVALDFGTPRQRWIDRLTLRDAKDYASQDRHFAKGSMRPKIEACIAFLENGGHRAVITTPDNVVAAVDGHAGTSIVPT